MTASIAADGLGVRFQFDRQSRVVSPQLARLRRRGEESWGLRGVSFAVGPGDGVALVGASGSGKTTLLRCIAGIFAADEGRIDVRGHVASLLSIDAGLTGELTGRENAMLLGVVAGLTRREVRRSLDEIRTRTALEDEFDHPVSSYSQGMRARLGFAVAVQAGADVLLLDEVHEALDHEFRSVVEEFTHGLLARGGIVVAAGHDHPLLERICRRGLLLSAGHLRADRSFGEVVREYLHE
jgi:ABC-type polysaccharide/polyol phosphate transport system ATPase subunit